jgi:GNAT superfamily N-acetyltransferase
MSLIECRLPQDAQSVHFGAFRGADLVSIVSAHPEDKFGGTGEWRIRGMATEPSVQGQGAGGAVLEALLAWGAAEGVPLFWCNARERAISFYQNHGFTVVSELFEIAGVGPHRVMKRAP